MLVAADYAVLAVYLIVVAAIGLAAGRHQTSTRAYFLADRQAPWWAAGMSILATETSALTFIGAPVQSLRGDWTYLQLAFGSALGRILVGSLLLGAYYKANVTTVYDFLAERFGPRSRDLSSALFIVGRLLGSGVRLYGASIALVVVADISFPIAIILISGVAVGYVLLGGLRSVIWTDVLQGALLVGGALVALAFLLRGTGMPLGEIFHQLSSASTPAGHSKLRVFDFSLDPRLAYTLWAGMIGSTFLTLSTHGTDQDMIQRALACENAERGRRGLWLSASLNIPVAALFLAIGSLLWLLLGGDGGALALAAEIAAEHDLPSAEKGFDFLFPFYVVQTLPVGIRGLIIAAIFATAMSSLDSAIGALSTTAVTSFWRVYVQPERSDSHQLVVARVLAVVFGALLVGVALIVRSSEGAGSASQGFGVLMLGLKVLSWIFPPLLGVFLVGVLTRRGSDRGNVVAVVTGIGLLLALEGWPALFGTPSPMAWTWNPLVGCLVTAAVAASFAPPAAPR